MDPEARLEYLNLENNLISDKAAEILSRIAVTSKHLKYLNLRKIYSQRKVLKLFQSFWSGVGAWRNYIGIVKINLIVEPNQLGRWSLYL